MSHPLGLEPDQINPDLPEEANELDTGVEMTPAGHWNKIVQLTEAIKLGVEDLQDSLREFRNNPKVPDLK